MVQTLLLPSFIWSCERYRADLRTVWEQCVAIMSEEDGDDGKPLTALQSPFFNNPLPERLQRKEGPALGKGRNGTGRDVVGGCMGFLLELGFSNHVFFKKLF